MFMVLHVLDGRYYYRFVRKFLRFPLPPKKVTFKFIVAILYDKADNMYGDCTRLFGS